MVSAPFPVTSGAAVLPYSLVPSLLLLGLAVVAGRRPPTPVQWWVYVGFGGPLALISGCLLGSVAVWLTFAALLVALGVWAAVRHRGGSFPRYGLAAVLAAYLVAFWLAAPTRQEHARLRADFPAESMADRVPAPAPAGRPLPPAAAADLTELNAEVQVRTDWYRNRQLRRLHEETTDLFVESPGFGVERMPSVPSRHTIEQEGRPGPPDQPGPRPADGYDPDPPAAVAEVNDGLRKLHRGAVVDFVNADGFGLVTDRRRVTGFRPHAFSAVPGREERPARWEVESVDLVGLLIHPEPVVYVSAKLPAMDQLRKAPTRPLTAFEAAGLEKLRAGEDYHVEGGGRGLRLVGSLRNGRSCATCHGGEVGDLLGAFSYTLRAAK